MATMNPLHDLLLLASSLVDIGTNHLSRRDEDSALILFESAHHMISAAPLQSSMLTALQHMGSGEDHLRSKVAQVSNHYANMDSLYAPDLYQEKESDVGPRILPTPIHIDQKMLLSSSEKDVTLVLAAALCFNTALTQQMSMHQAFEAKQLYQRLVRTLQIFLVPFGQVVSNDTTTGFLTPMLGMRVHNNLGVAAYVEGNNEFAINCFREASIFSTQLAKQGCHDFQLEHATVLSNWCRLCRMRRDIRDPVYAGLKEILRIRSSILSWDHPDVAAAHFNLAVAEYSRGEGHEAIPHL
jgi:hypothetical protein